MKINLLSFIITCILLQCSISASTQTANESYYAKLQLLKDMEGKASPSFDAITLSGKQVNLESLKGKTVVINFWFVGCKTI
jgi:cytochrome oxidase Cu insertion factor (SCO1/SenC/PrrC family)